MCLFPCKNIINFLANDDSSICVNYYSQASLRFWLMLTSWTDRILVGCKNFRRIGLVKVFFTLNDVFTNTGNAVNS